MYKLITFILIRILSNPLANVFQKKLAEENSSFTVNFWGYIILTIFCIPFIPNISTSYYTIEFWIYVFLAGFLCALGNACLIKAISIGELSVIGPVNSYKCIIGLISSMILLKEFPSFLGLIGMFLIIYGSKFMFQNTKEGFSFKLFKRKDIQLRLLALLLTGIEASMLKKIILLSSVKTCFIYWCISGAFWALIFILLGRKKLLLNSKNNILLCSILACCLGLMQYSTNYVFKYLNVGYSLALFQISSVFTVIFGVKLFKERHFLIKLTGCLIMIIGACLIILN